MPPELAPVQLASGEWSSDLIDRKEALWQWEDLFTASQAIVETVRDAGHEFDAAGGLTLEEGDRVLLVDDVVTSGGSSLKAKISSCRPVPRSSLLR